MKYKRSIVLLVVLFLSISSLMVPFIETGSASEDKIEWNKSEKIEKGRFFWADMDGNNIYIYGDILARSRDDGESWSFRYDDGHYEVENGVLYRVWMNASAYHGKTLQFCKSDDLRKEWSDPVDIFTLKGQSGGIYGVKKIDSNLFVYSYDGYQGMWSIKVSRSSDGGETWSDPTVLASQLSIKDPFAEGIIPFKGDLYMSYYTDTGEGSEVIVSKSEDEGDSWEKKTIAEEGFNPLLRTNGDRLYLTYLKDDGVRFTKSSDGKRWNDPQKIGEFLDFNSACNYHSITARSNLIFVGYIRHNKLKESYDFKMIYSEDKGNSWDEIGSPTGLNGNSVRPILQINEKTLHLFWSYMGKDTFPSNEYEQYHRSASIGALYDDGSDDLPGFTLVMFMIAVNLMVFFWRKKEVNR
ncbi:MAG: sialidase family protein [Thermoplasmatota archaeon]